MDQSEKYIYEKHLQTDDEQSIKDKMHDEYCKEKGIPSLKELIEERRNRNGKTE